MILAQLSFTEPTTSKPRASGDDPALTKAVAIYAW